MALVRPPVTVIGSELGSLRFEDVVVAADTRALGHAHELPHLCCVLAGGFVEEHAGREVAMTAGAVRLSAAGSHRLRFGPEGARCLVIELGEHDRQAIDLGTRTTIDHDAHLARIAAQLASDLARASCPIELESDVLELIAQITRRRSVRVARTPPSWLERARERLQSAPLERPVDLAAAAGVHRVHLVRAFRDHYGVSLGDFVRRLKLQRAYQLLATDAPLAQVAAEAGFTDQSHMTRCWRRAFGTTPARMRGRGTA